MCVCRSFFYYSITARCEIREKQAVSRFVYSFAVDDPLNWKSEVLRLPSRFSGDDDDDVSYFCDGLYDNDDRTRECSLNSWYVASLMGTLPWRNTSTYM